MAKRLADLGKTVEDVLGGREKLVQAERRVVKALNRALGRIGYKVVAKTGQERERVRRARKKVATRKRRARRKETAGRRRPKKNAVTPRARPRRRRAKAK